MFSVTTKLEINIRRGPTVARDIMGLGILMVKNRMPAVVVDPEFIEPMFFERQRVNAQYKILTTIDFYDGTQYAMDKLRTIPRFCLESDGFEILLSPGRNDSESKNELKAITEFLRGINPLIDIRWVLGLKNRKYEEVKNCVSHFKEYPCSFVRTNTNTTAPNLGLEKHLFDIEFIKKYYGGQVKVSGNVDLTLIKALPDIRRFDVSLTQYKGIVKEWKEGEIKLYNTKQEALNKPGEKPKETPVQAPV
jgi:hypothetical protein